jgi:hypothetical protein
MARKKPTAHESRVSAFVQNMPDAHIECRDFGHSWKPQTATWLDDGTIERVLACSRCTTRRYQALDRKGYILSSHYAYPEHYLIEGVGRLTADDRAMVRISNIDRVADA